MVNPITLRSLNAVGTNPPFFLVSLAQIQFSPHGDNLVISVKGSNSIRVFAVDAHGKPRATSMTTISNGETPFGFSFDRRAVSSYKLVENRSLRTISQSVDNFQAASCWLVTTRRIPYAYTTNNASHTISGYAIGRTGKLSLLNATGVSAFTGDSPVDLTVTKSGKYLYALNAGSGTISIYKIARKNGSLTSLAEIGGLPVHNGTVGIAVR